MRGDSINCNLVQMEICNFVCLSVFANLEGISLPCDNLGIDFVGHACLLVFSYVLSLCFKLNVSFNMTISISLLWLIQTFLSSCKT